MKIRINQPGFIFFPAVIFLDFTERIERKIIFALSAISLLVISGSAHSFAEEPECSGLTHTIPQWVWQKKLPSGESVPHETLLENDRVWGNVSLGIGYLSPGDALFGEEWFFDILYPLPLYESPAGILWGWLTQGTVIHRFRKEVMPVGLSGIVRTEKGSVGLVIYDVTDSGWVKFRYMRPSNSYEGTAWTHMCYFEALPYNLHFVNWDEFFMISSLPPFLFRDGTGHILRTSSNRKSEKRMLIHGDYHLRLLEMQDDWMHVEVKTPSDYCDRKWSSENPRTREGWIQWRSRQKGPWIWPHPQDCSDAGKN